MDGDKDVEMESAGEPATSPATVKGSTEADQADHLGPSSPADGERPSDADAKQG